MRERPVEIVRELLGLVQRLLHDGRPLAGVPTRHGAGQRWASTSDGILANAGRNLRSQVLGVRAGSWPAATKNTAVASMLVQTANLHGLDVQAYRNWALERVAACEQPEDYAALTPMAHEAAPKRVSD